MYWKRLKLVSVPVLLAVGIDRFTKIWATKTLYGEAPRSFWNDYFRLQYAENEGAFLSLGSGLPEQLRYWLLAIIPVLVLSYIFYHVLVDPYMDRWRQVAFGLILGGGGSNIFDRIVEGSVVDFLNMGIGQFRTGIFNVADMAIMAGLFLMLPAVFAKHPQQEPESPPAEPEGAADETGETTPDKATGEESASSSNPE